MQVLGIDENVFRDEMKFHLVDTWGRTYKGRTLSADFVVPTMWERMDMIFGFTQKKFFGVPRFDFWLEQEIVREAEALFEFFLHNICRLPLIESHNWICPTCLKSETETLRSW